MEFNTDLERRLHSDHKGMLAAQLIASLTCQQRAIALQMKQPLRPEQYRPLASAHNACGTGIAVIEGVWRRFHGQNAALPAPSIFTQSPANITSRHVIIV